MSRADHKLFVIVDGGGSSSRARIYDSGGNPLSNGSSGPANPCTDCEKAFRHIEEAIGIAYSEAGLSGRSRGADALCLALAGAKTFDGFKNLPTRLNFAHVSLYSDAEATVAGALGSSDGIVAGIGTGSFFVARTSGSSRCVGGHGFQISDECSGAWLGRSLLGWTVRACDGMYERTSLVEQTLGRFGGSVTDLVAFSLSAGPAEYAELAPLVIKAAEVSDPLAVKIMGQAFGDLCGILEFLDAKSVGLICMTGGLGPVYRSLASEEYGEFLADPAGDALDGGFELLVHDMERASHGF